MTSVPAAPGVDPSARGPAVTRVRRAVARALDADQVVRTGERVVVACSGGPDSSVLLDVLARLGPPRRLALVVAHVDHGLRDAGVAEADHVAALARATGVEDMVALRVTVASVGGSLQDRARRARHRVLEELALTCGATAIAFGHTADDQAETVVMRALRGATPRGLAAMSPRSGLRARPLLRIWRSEVEAYCTERGIEPLRDPSNADPRFLRTRVRHEVIPALEAVFPAARRRLVALADRERRVLTP